MQGTSNSIEAAFQDAQQVRNSKDDKNFLKKGTFYTLSSSQFKDRPIKMIVLVGNIPVNIEKAVRYYNSDFNSQIKNREMIDSITVVEVIDENNLIKAILGKGKVSVSARQMISHQQTKRLSENEIVIFNLNVESHAKVSVKQDIVRGEVVIYAQFFTKLSDKETKVENFILNDPKGDIPIGFINSIMEKQLDIFENDVNSMQSL